MHFKICMSYSFYTVLYRLKNGKSNNLEIATRASYLIGIYLCSLCGYHLWGFYVLFPHSTYSSLPPPFPPLSTLQIWVTKKSASLPQVHTGTIWTLPGPLSLSKAEKNASMLNYENVISLSNFTSFLRSKLILQIWFPSFHDLVTFAPSPPHKQ